MARKTNKTAHVLNLISKAKDEHQAMEEQMQIDNTGSDVSNDLLFMGIEPTNDKSISEKINDNLETFVENGEELSQHEPQITEVNEEFTEDIQDETQYPLNSEIHAVETNESDEEETILLENQPQPITQTELAEMHATSTISSDEITEMNIDSTVPTDKIGEINNTTMPSEEIPEMNTTSITLSDQMEEMNPNSITPSDQIPSEIPAESDEEKVFYYINVYESLVVERLGEFQKMFDACTCPRCSADIIALALTNLPARYIVSDNKKTIPLLSFYREKFKTAIAAQLSHACIVVKQNPNH